MLPNTVLMVQWLTVCGWKETGQERCGLRFQPPCRALRLRLKVTRVTRVSWLAERQVEFAQCVAHATWMST